MSIDTTAIRDRVTSRSYGWSQPAGAPEPIRRAAAEYHATVNALDDALVDYEVEEGQRRTILKQHNAAVAEALRDGKKPPAAKVPSLEELEVRHGAIIAAREGFVHEAAATADRVAQQHYPQWRAEVLEQLEGAAAALAQATMATAQAASDWGSAAQILARLDRTWAPRQAKFDDASVLGQIDRWSHTANIEATQLGRNVALHTDRLRLLTQEPVIVEYDPAGGVEQYSAAYLAQQSPATREILTHRAAASVPGAPPLSEPTDPTTAPDAAVFLDAS
jgi:hypothetical protein